MDIMSSYWRYHTPTGGLPHPPPPRLMETPARMDGRDTITHPLDSVCLASVRNFYRIDGSYSFIRIQGNPVSYAGIPTILCVQFSLAGPKETLRGFYYSPISRHELILVLSIALTTEARALALASSTENQTIGNGGNHVGKEKKAKSMRAWGFKSTMKKAPSKPRPATRIRWVARAPRLMT